VRIVVLGSPGAGKGTYSGFLSERLGIPHISTGDLLREIVKEESDLGKEVKGYMERGELVPDELVLKVLVDRISKDDCKKGFILDGFPRTLEQALKLSELLDIDLAINFNCDEETVLERLGGRITCRSCGKIYHLKNIRPKREGICDDCGGELYQREDQKPEAIKKRLEIYREKSEPLIEFYRREGKLREVDANRPIERVEEVINDCLQHIKEVM